MSAILKLEIIGKISSSCWVAEITGFDPDYNYRRTFPKPKIDRSRANSVGTRGVYKIYTLEEGHIYEVKEQISWQRSQRYFCTVANGQITALTKKQMIQIIKLKESGENGKNP